jgi:SAM-dependent methyltransferase
MRMLDEIALAGPEHLSSTYIETYDRKARFDPSDDVAELRKRGLDSGSTVIDFGAGTGTFAVAAAPVCKRVVANDVSPAMVAATNKKAVNNGLTDVECIRAGFLSYQHTARPPISSTRATLSITFPTSGRRQRFTGWLTFFGRVESCDYAISSLRSTLEKPSGSSTRGSRARQNPPMTAGRARSSRRISETNTALSPGYSNR